MLFEACKQEIKERIENMAKTEPIRNIQDIKKLKEYFKKNNRSRDYLLFTLGVNTALRISDILCLRYNDVIDFESGKVKKHLNLKEQKTGKDKCCFLNEVCVCAINEYYNETNGSKEEYLFQSRKGTNQPITRQRAYCIIKEAASYTGLSARISCHSMRKTFGYHAWKTGVSPAIIMDIFNHSSMKVTKIYLGITQDDTDDVYRKILL